MATIHKSVEWLAQSKPYCYGLGIQLLEKREQYCKSIFHVFWGGL